ncbi:MAG: DedA family protein [Acidobacteria bacterium]|nr:DedA family protein [Acidobacteriota bacterium]
MGELEAFLRTYGLWAVFFLAAVEGDLTLLLAGMLVHLGVWPAGTTFAVGTAGALAGDCVYFWLGHGAARRWLTTAHGQRVMPRIERAARRYGLKSLFFARYIHGARIATMFFWGMQRTSLLKFAAFDALSCCIWASIFIGLGYLFADSMEQLLGELRRIESWILLGVVVFATLLGVRYYLAERNGSLPRLDR